MTLPSSGQLSLKNIYEEIYGSHTTQQASLRAMSSAASKTSPDAVSDFYGYSSGSISISPDNITQNWGSDQLGFTTVTSSGAWSAISLDPDGILNSYTSSGSGSGKATFSTTWEEWESGFFTITYRLTSNTSINTTLSVCVNGQFEMCF